MQPRFTLLLFCAAHLLFVGTLNAQDEQTFRSRQEFGAARRVHKRIAPDSFKLDPLLGKDLKIEVWASSPLLFSPIAMDMDEQGRMWLTEGLDFSHNPYQQLRVTGGQSIIVVTDRDGDGKADKSHVFVTEKSIRHAPLGIAVFDNKIVLSVAPNLIVYTDVNRNALFDRGIDKREVFLTGFRGAWHDHTLHAVVGSPSGQWYFSYGNCGADVRTKDDRRFVSSSFYHNSHQTGIKSSDGNLYIGGLAMRINPDGTGLTMVGQNLRNSHDMAVNSFGDVFQNDNDDPPHCRATWLMEYGNFGYASLYDGSRSWQETAKSWETPGSRLYDYNGLNHLGRRHTPSHWRENYPGTIPPGTVYGSGSPVGAAFYEGDALGPQMRGTFLSCEMVRKEVQIYQPKLKDAQIAMGPNRALVDLKPFKKRAPFLPTDVVAGTDGALYLCDMYNNTSERNNLLSGTIYRISRKDEGKVTRPRLNYTSTAGLIEALKNPASSVRATAVPRLAAKGDALVPQLMNLFKTQSNPFVQARAIWVLAQTGPKGRGEARKLLQSNNPQWRLIAYRALRKGQPKALLEHARMMADDPNPSVRREVALSLRDLSYEQSRDILRVLIEGYDGENRWYLEALGTAATGKETEVYSRLIRPQLIKIPFSKWNDRAKHLAWRFHTPEAINDLSQVIMAQKPPVKEFRRLASAFASYSSLKEQSEYKSALEKMATHPAFKEEAYQRTVREFVSKDLTTPKGSLLSASYLIPKVFGKETKVSNVKTIAALKGDARRGKAQIQRCFMCHKVAGQGIDFGPDLTRWGQPRAIEEIVEAMVHPAAKLAPGFDTPMRIRDHGHVAEGMYSNYAKHGPGSQYGGSLSLKVFGGQTHKIFFSHNNPKIEVLKKHSWMPPASKQGLSDQDIRDIAQYLKTL